LYCPYCIADKAELDKFCFVSAREVIMKNRHVYLFIAVLIFIIAIPGCSKLSEVSERKVKEEVRLEGYDVGGLKESQVLEIIENYASKNDKEAVNAKLDENTWEVYAEKQGQKVNVDKTLEAVLNANEGEKVKYVVEKAYPKVTCDMLQNNIVEIASYSTPLLNRSDNRINNIQLAVEEIDYYKLEPGEEFSFNRVVGKRTKAKGYEEAPIIIRTEDGPKKGNGVGGGVCQISSTLYNVVEECGLDITERHIHSKNVGYVPRGEDATVTYGSVDFKFRNNRKHPVMIRVWVSEKRVTAKIVENRN